MSICIIGIKLYIIIFFLYNNFVVGIVIGFQTTGVNEIFLFVCKLQILNRQTVLII